MTEIFVRKHRAKSKRILAALIGAAVVAFGLSTHAAPAPAVMPIAALNEQVTMIPVVSGGSAIQLETTIFKPPGDGPFPLVIMNHGKALGSPRTQQRDRFVAISREFVRRGYAVVIPM